MYNINILLHFLQRIVHKTFFSILIYFYIPGEKPFKIEVFEDYLYLSTYNSHNVLRVNKFGNGNFTYLALNMPRLSEILIIHENRQQKGIENRCEGSCHSSHFCLLNPGGSTCTCADGYAKDNLVSI